MNTKYPRQVRIIRNARKAMGYSQQQVAPLIGVHIRQYQRMERDGLRKGRPLYYAGFIVPVYA